jgi:ABC-type glycerol-3-phosphate transport system substrate-binding protein
VGSLRSDVRTDRQLVRFWWWGEDEAPGLAGWVARTALQHELDAGARVETRLLRHDRVLTSLPEAALAGTAPDLHFLWNGIYHIEHAWDGLLAPLEELFPRARVAEIGGGPQSRFRGQTYRAAWYLIPVVWVANRQVLERGGVDALPTTWDELVDCCERLVAAGVPAIVAGDGEGDLSVWWLTHLLTQELDHGADVALLALGEQRWREPRYARPWHELQRFVESGWIERSSLALTLWDAFGRFCGGMGAFTLASGPMFARCRQLLGERVEMMQAPRLGHGALASHPIVDSQGLGIPAHAPDPQAGAALLSTVLSPTAADALYDHVGLVQAGGCRESPASEGARDTRWFGECHRRGETAPYVPNLLPLPLHFNVCAGIGRSVIAGRLDARDAGREADARCRGWADADPVRRALYAEWIEDVRQAETMHT